ncbi:MAG: type I restriction enzyme HsdR N-terminal domain-containing protein [Lentisphaeria bacterium]|nr:type I restriction enzyme HsdR N-terminal domain-containing protein [Lentisphaeria bacterium]
MKEFLAQLAERIEKTKGVILTEEATKNAYIMPFLQLLGYDVFNPLEVVPEFTADVGIKEGEKVDYAIVLNGQPEILIECKMCDKELSAANESQLLRYFHASKAKFGILTNGIIYKFYTDLAEPNKMDLNAFLTINILEFDKINYTELNKFKKENFDADNIRRTAEMLKYTSSIRQILISELSEPSEDFVRLVFKQMESGKIFNSTQKEKLTPLVKSALDTIVAEKVKASLDAALKTTEETTATAAEIVQAPILGADTGITTTQSETDAFNIVRAIASEIISPEKIYIRDAKSYCAILFDDNNRKPICRLFFNNEANKAIVFFNGIQEEKVFINSVEEIFSMRNRIIETIQKYLG